MTLVVFSRQQKYTWRNRRLRTQPNPDFRVEWFYLMRSFILGVKGFSVCQPVFVGRPPLPLQTDSMRPHRQSLPRPPSPKSCRRRCCSPPVIQCGRDIPPPPAASTATVPDESSLTPLQVLPPLPHIQCKRRDAPPTSIAAMATVPSP